MVTTSTPAVVIASTTAVVIAHRNRLARAGFSALLDDAEDVAVAGDVANLEDALALVSQSRPAVLVLDIALLDLDGLDALRRIAARVVLVADGHDAELLLPALRAGVTGVVLEEDADAIELVRAVRAVAAREGFLSPNVARRLIDEFAATPDTSRPPPEQLDELTPRELEVVSLVARGMSNAEIAEHLVVSPATAKTHVSRALCKVHARDRSQLVTLAYECGLIVPQAVTA
jgi:DNA-binding NarL/FixJ family response regulator